MGRLKIASAWLGGCSGCHMSFLDMDEWLLEMAAKADYVWGPFVDTKEYPEDVDIALVEGAVCNEENVEVVRKVRHNTKYVISFGDCAVSGNVTAMRNPLGTALPVLTHSYEDLTTLDPAIPGDPVALPVLLERVQPVHEVIEVDFHLTGCPPSGTRIREVVDALLNGRVPPKEPEMIKFG